MGEHFYASGSKSTAPILLTRDKFDQLCGHLPRLTREVLRFLLGLTKGAITLSVPSGQRYRISSGQAGPEAEIEIRRWRFARRAMLRGDVGLGESYADGDWDSPNLAAVIAFFALNLTISDNYLARSPLVRVLLQIRHFLNRNTRIGSKKNISAHYDLGNAFYAAWLDPSMTYSSAIFAPGDNDLTAAQNRKYRTLADAMGVKPGAHVLEIGCGWGGFAEYLAKERGALVTGLTISREQLAYAQERMQAAGLSERVTLKFQDYRDERGVYDHIGSIEMFEAVGEAYWPSYFHTLKTCLKPGGTAGLQIITIDDRWFENYRRNIDFIRRHIFPGGMLPSPSKLKQLAAGAALTSRSDQGYARDYAETLRQWCASFEAAWPRLTSLGFDERFRRLWRYYLTYCEAGFDTACIDVRQIVYQR